MKSTISVGNPVIIAVIAVVVAVVVGLTIWKKRNK